MISPEDITSSTSLEQTNTLCDCSECASNLVYPVEWEEEGATKWKVSFRCPNCEWTGTEIHVQKDVELLDEALDRGTEALASDLRTLTQHNMELEIGKFVSALQAGAVWPEDFGVPSQ